MKNLRKAKGFTLIELIVVVVIIGILATIGIAGYNSITEKANENADAADARTVVSVLSADTAVAGVGTVAAFLGDGTAIPVDGDDLTWAEYEAKFGDLADRVNYTEAGGVVITNRDASTTTLDISGAVAQLP